MKRLKRFNQLHKLALGTVLAVAGLALAGPVAAEGYMAAKPDNSQEVETNVLAGTPTGSVKEPAMLDPAAVHAGQPYAGKQITDLRTFLVAEPKTELTSKEWAQIREETRRSLIGR